MGSCGARRAGAVAAGVLFVGGGHAYGQAIGYQLNRFEPTPAGDVFSVVEYPWYAAERHFAAGLTFDYARNLLVAPGAPAPIANSQTAHLDLAGSVWSRVALSLSVPFVVSQTGETFAGVGPSGTTLGDPRAGARVRLYGDVDAALTVSAAAYLWIPIGAEDDLAGDTTARGMARATMGGVWNDRVRWAVNGSLLARRSAQLSDTTSGTGNTVGSELQFSAAASYLALDRRLGIGPEVITSFALASGLPDEQRVASAEMFLTAHATVTDDVLLGVGVGGSLAGEPGPPDARVLLSLAYAPTPRRGSSFERVIVLPDEDGHVGGVVVDDGKTKTVLDKPYASTEIRRKDKVAKAVTAAPQSAQATALARSLPPSDRDRDGIIDAEDGCPDRAGRASADLVRHGCPTAAEKIVVLPDADGHVGGVEVDDGTTKVLIDQPYGSVEVDSDGAVRAVPPAPAKSIDRAIATVATALPPADADEDGVLDADDACPDRAGVTSPDPIRRGCPAAAERIVVVPDADGHVGGVEVDDGKTKVVIDQPFGSVEVGGDGSARLVAPSPSARSAERAIAAIAKTLPIADGDGDGIRYEDDACPDRAGVASPDPLRRGCPIVAERVIVIPDDTGHVGAVEIDDGKTKVVLDRPYATAEVTSTGAAVTRESSVTAIVKATGALGRAMPLADRDDDAIADRDDACPDRKGPPSSDAARSGCPTTVERVVVLADENGAVGAVEVDDGTTKTVLDKEYASAEIGIDGRARAIAAEATDVSARFAAAMAARPAGARIILYFTARSEPARDLTGPIDNLVAEVKAKPQYAIEVVGHTDQTGSERANVRIGRERAQLIADKLIAAGVPADRITVKSMGSREPAVKRKSRRVVELRNRRVEIWVR